MTKRQAWQVWHDEARRLSYHWEMPDGSGLLLSVCAGCGEHQTRATYVSGFWREFVTLEQGLSIRAIAQHSCGTWHRYID